MNYADKTIVVIDNGLFTFFAETLAESFGTVYYWSPWVNRSPNSNDLMVGQGLPRVTRVKSFWEIASEVDLWVFPDCGYGDLQVWLASQDARVWGSRLGEELELDRVRSKELCAEAGINIGPYRVVQGMTELRDYLKQADDVFVKISSMRGDVETFHSENYKLIEPQLDRLEWQLGAKKELMTFVVEQAIPDAVETGYDLYTIDGKFPSLATYGIEVKSRAFLMECCPYNRLPKTLRDINEKWSPLLRDYGYRGSISNEVRVTENGTGYLIDPTCRLPSPPGELQCINISNWADIVWEGADGVLVEPDFIARYGVSARLVSEWALTNWQPVYFPDAISDFVKLYSSCQIDGVHYVIPGLLSFGTVSATDDTIEGAIRKLRSYVSQIEGYGISATDAALDDAVTEYERLLDIDQQNA